MRPCQAICLPVVLRDGVGSSVLQAQESISGSADPGVSNIWYHVQVIPIRQTLLHTTGNAEYRADRRTVGELF